MSQSNFIEWESPYITEHQKPSTCRVKKRVRVFQSQICRQQVVTRTSAVFLCLEKKKDFFEKITPREMRLIPMCESLSSKTTRNSLKEII